MASRQEEKEARRQARIEQEEAERRAAGRRKRIQILAGGLVGVIVVAVAVIAIASSGGSKGGTGNAGKVTANGVKLPARVETDLDTAAKAAGCTVSNPPDEGRGHENKTFTQADYKTNPPTSGTHFPQWAQDGIYTEKTVPQLGMLVHTLEHGRIDVQYKPGTSPTVVKQLEAFLDESDGGRHMLLYPNTTNMDAAVAATAWDHSLTCASVGDKTWDALRAFRERYIDKGPEIVP